MLNIFRPAWQIKNVLPTSAFIALTCLVAGCGEKPTPVTPTPKIESSKLFEQERSALEKAKGVEQQLNKNTEQFKQDAEKQAQ